MGMVVYYYKRILLIIRNYIDVFLADLCISTIATRYTAYFVAAALVMPDKAFLIFDMTSSQPEMLCLFSK